METYSFEVVIGFRVQADNKHDALRYALDTESSLNEASVRSISGNVVRSIAPTMQHFAPFEGSVPEQPAERSRSLDFKRRHKLLDPLTHNWHVVLEYNGYDKPKQYVYTVTKPTEEQAIEQARMECYWKHSHMGKELTLVSVEQEGQHG